MRKITYLLSSFLLILTGFTSCNEDPVNATEQTNNVAWIKVKNIDGGVLYMKQDETFAISVLMFPEEAIDKDKYSFQFRSSNDQVATVNEEGIITAIGGGEATISVIPSHNEKLGFSFKAQIKATPNILLSDEIKEGISIEIDENSTEHTLYDLSAQLKVVPEESADKTLTYNIDNESIATIDANGIISPLSVGETTITVSWEAEEKTITIPLTIEAMKVGPLDRTGWMVTDLNDATNSSGEKLIDGDPNTGYKLTNKKEEIVSGFTINKTNSQSFFAIQIEQNTSKKAYIIQFDLFGSDNGENWQIIKREITIDEANKENNTIQLEKSYTYQYIKIEITHIGNKDRNFDIKELNLIGNKE